MNEKGYLRTIWGQPITRKRKSDLIMLVFVYLFLMAGAAISQCLESSQIEYMTTFDYKHSSLWGLIFWELDFGSILMIVLAIPTLILIIVLSSKSSVQADVKRLGADISIELAKDKEKEDEKNQQIQSYNNELAELQSLYGVFSKKIQCGWIEYDINNYFIVFPESSILFFNGSAVPFKDIITYEVETIYENKTQTTEVTKTKTGSVIGRSLIGGIIAGPVGAIIGGATAKKTSSGSTVSSSSDISEHIVKITVNEITMPLRQIHLTGSDIYKVNDIAAVLNVVINQNRQGYGK